MLGKRKLQLSSKMNESSLMATRCRRLFCLLFTYVLISSSSVMKLAAGSKTKGNSSAVHVDVGVIFGREDWVGRMGLTCMQMALSDFYASHPHYNTRIRLHVRDSGQGAVGAAAAALYLMEKVKVKAIVGPVTSMEARFVIDLGAKAQVPIISYSATSPFLSYGQLPYFIRATQNDSGQVLAIGALMQAFGWREVVLIYMENEYGENIVSNLGRFVVIVWVFVVLILTQSYTASLTSMLTAQLQPTATDLNELIKKGEYVGYQSGSFVEGLLHGLGVSDSKLRAYNNFWQLDELLSNGSSNGGIAAAVDTIPFMNLFLYNHCSKYTTIQLPYGTGGFGYVFPLGSPLLHDISKAIMNVTEGDEIIEIEEKWIAKKKSCLNSSSVATTASLGLESFWGLFLIVGIASVLALSASTVMFLYKQKNIWMRADTSLWTKIQVLAKIFNERDTEFPPFKKTEQQWSRHGNSPSIQTHCDDAVDTEPNTDYPPSPSAHSVNYAERNTMSLSDGVSPSPDRRLPFQICM